MEISINQEKIQFEIAPASIQELLEQHYPTLTSGFAIALNQQVISRDLWKTTPIQSHDQILIISATQGG